VVPLIVRGVHRAGCDHVDQHVAGELVLRQVHDRPWKDVDAGLVPDDIVSDHRARTQARTDTNSGEVPTDLGPEQRSIVHLDTMVVVPDD
jgi:hypothetical protein